MENLQRMLPGRFIRLVFLLLLAALLLAGTAFWSGTRVEANHPVLVEGNCDSPVPGTTLVAPGTCGDFDGDGRIGTAEDTDGADRIFGTLRAALGPGAGAAAGTGANQNGLVLIVTSGRFAEALLIIGQPISGFEAYGGVANPGNVTIEAAPGVDATIDAVLQGDPAGGNNMRQEQIGIVVNYSSSLSNRTVTLRNLKIRNFLEGVAAIASSRLTIENCFFENNLDNGLRISESAKVAVSNSQFNANGFRISSAQSTPTVNNGNAIVARDRSLLRVNNTTISHSFRAGIAKASTANVQIYRVTTYFNNPDIIGTVTIASNPNFSQ